MNVIVRRRQCSPKICAVALLILATPGCAAGGFLAHLLGGGSQIKAQYALVDRSTAVLVDDPKRVLGAPALPGVVANNVKHDLEKHKVLKTAAIVSQDEVNQLAKRLGNEFAATPIDQIGHSLGVEQVIHIEVESATLYEYARQVTRPRCTVRVKVIDVVNRQRLFPEAGVQVDSAYTPPGHLVKVEMETDAVDNSGTGVQTMLYQQLAEEAGRQVAQLFYDHGAPEPGRMIK